MTGLTAAESLARQRVCLPLDGLETLEAVRRRVEELHPFVGMFKVGKESFTRFGPAVVELVCAAGSEVFLDLKYHDIPNTVRGAARAAAAMGVSLLNVHASGGSAMMAAAREGVEEAVRRGEAEAPPRVVAVTVLTSIDEETLHRECRVGGPLTDHVLHLARLAQASGLDGIVCSARDLAGLRPHFPGSFLFVTPGIKGTKTPAGEDQRRVMSPGRAIEAGSSLLVVGRAITAAPDPIAAARDLLRDVVAHLPPEAAR